MIPDDQPNAAPEQPQTAASPRTGAPRRRSRRGGRRHSRRRGGRSAEAQEPNSPTDSVPATEAGDAREEVETRELAAADDTGEAPMSDLEETDVAPAGVDVEPGEATGETEAESERTPESGVQRREERPSREGRQSREERFQKQHRPEPQPPVQEFKTPAITEAIDDVTKIIDDLKNVLNDMEELLETLELAERQKIDDERELESLQRALRQLRQHQPGGHHRR